MHVESNEKETQFFLLSPISFLFKDMWSRGNIERNAKILLLKSSNWGNHCQTQFMFIILFSSSSPRTLSLLFSLSHHMCQELEQKCKQVLNQIHNRQYVIKKSDGILFGQAHTHHIRKYNKKEPGWQVATQQLV